LGLSYQYKRNLLADLKCFNSGERVEKRGSKYRYLF